MECAVRKEVATAIAGCEIIASVHGESIVRVVPMRAFGMKVGLLENSASAMRAC